MVSGLARVEEELERRLDEALEATFPASDPIAVSSIEGVTARALGVCLGVPVEKSASNTV